MVRCVERSQPSGRRSALHSCLPERPVPPLHVCKIPRHEPRHVRLDRARRDERNSRPLPCAIAKSATTPSAEVVGAVLYLGHRRNRPPAGRSPVAPDVRAGDEGSMTGATRVGETMNSGCGGDATDQSNARKRPWPRSLHGRLVLIPTALLLLGLVATIGIIFLHAQSRIAAEVTSSVRLGHDPATAALRNVADAERPADALDSLVQDLPQVRHVQFDLQAFASGAAPASQRRIGDVAYPYSQVLAPLLAPPPVVQTFPVVVHGLIVGKLIMSSHPTDEIAEIIGEVELFSGVLIGLCTLTVTALLAKLAQLIAFWQIRYTDVSWSLSLPADFDDRDEAANLTLYRGEGGNNQRGAARAAIVDRPDPDLRAGRRHRAGDPRRWRGPATDLPLRVRTAWHHRPGSPAQRLPGVRQKHCCTRASLWKSGSRDGNTLSWRRCMQILLIEDHPIVRMRLPSTAARQGGNRSH